MSFKIEMVEVNEAREINSEFSQIFSNQKNPKLKRSEIDSTSFEHPTNPLFKKIDLISSSRSSTSTNSSLSCSPIDTKNSQNLVYGNATIIKDSKKISSNHRVESYLNEMSQQQSPSINAFQADECKELNKIKQEQICNESSKKLPKFAENYVDKTAIKNGNSNDKKKSNKFSI